MTRLLGAISLAAAFACAFTGAARADYVWDGPRYTAQTIYGFGTGTNVFYTDGFFNDAPGDSFSYAVRGPTFGFGAGYDWQTGPIVYGLETVVITGMGGVSNYDIPSPYDPDQDFELKFHWGAMVNARVGFALDRTLFYVQGGPAFAHIITEANDVDDGRVRLGRWPLGVTAGFGVERAVTDRMTFGLGYRLIAFAPAAIVSTNATPTDHTVQYRAHFIQISGTWRFDQAAEVRGRGLEGFDWQGAYFGILTGSPASFHSSTGFNFVLADRFVFGPEVRGSIYACCNLGFGAEALGRAGVIVDDHLLLYAAAGVRLRNDLFTMVGGGMEIAMAPRFTGVMELAALKRFGGEWGEVSFMGGVRIHLGANGLP